MSSIAHDIMVRYQKRRPPWLPGHMAMADAELIGYQNWRTAWLATCLDHIHVSDQLQNDPYVIKAKFNVASPPHPRFRELLRE